MEMIIEELARMEASARTAVDDALAQKERLSELIARMKDEIVKEALARADAEIEAARVNAGNEAEERLSLINESSKRWIKSLEEQFAQNRAAWEAEIFSVILELD